MNRHTPAVSVFALATVIVGVGACGEDTAPPAPSPTAAPSPSSSPGTSPTTPPPASPATSDPEPDMTNPVPPTSIVDRAVADLADRLSVEPGAISVVTAEDVTWSDGSLGCPEPGRSYTQALVNGTLIRLAVDGIEYEYHAGRGGDPFYCPADRATAPTGGLAPNS